MQSGDVVARDPFPENPFVPIAVSCACIVMAGTVLVFGACFTKYGSLFRRRRAGRLRLQQWMLVSVVAMLGVLSKLYLLWLGLYIWICTSVSLTDDAFPHAVRNVGIVMSCVGFCMHFLVESLVCLGRIHAFWENEPRVRYTHLYGLLFTSCILFVSETFWLLRPCQATWFNRHEKPLIRTLGWLLVTRLCGLVGQAGMIVVAEVGLFREDAYRRQILSLQLSIMILLTARFIGSIVMFLVELNRLGITQVLCQLFLRGSCAEMTEQIGREHDLFVDEALDDFAALTMSARPRSSLFLNEGSVRQQPPPSQNLITPTPSTLSIFPSYNDLSTLLNDDDLVYYSDAAEDGYHSDTFSFNDQQQMTMNDTTRSVKRDPLGHFHSARATTHAT